MGARKTGMQHGVGRAVFEPGWRWAESVQPLAKTKSCEAPHFQYHVSGVQTEL
jgi:hypothetical protein